MANENLNHLTVVSDGVNDWYCDLLDGILERGEDVSPRGLPTKEIRPVTVIIQKPREKFLTCPGRLIHPYFQVMESIWILAGRGDLWFIKYYLKNMEKYADGQNEFHAPYGVRMRGANRHRDGEIFYRHGDEEIFSGGRDQFLDCYKCLKKDQNTRQAVMTFWNPALDHSDMMTNDRPCNIAFQFLIRNGKLDLTIFNRSNDLNWGLAHTNVVQFSVILETMSMLLDIPIGNQIHMINSLHVYDYQGELTKRVLGAKYSFNVYEHVEPLPFKMDLPEKDRIEVLDAELKRFFVQEKNIRSGTINDDDPDPSFNYLQGALILARSFYYYKQGNWDKAANELSCLQADDIFVSCLEFIMRKYTTDLSIQLTVREIIQGRFSAIEEEKVESMIRFVTDH